MEKEKFMVGTDEILEKHNDCRFVQILDSTAPHTHHVVALVGHMKTLGHNSFM